MWLCYPKGRGTALSRESLAFFNYCVWCIDDNLSEWRIVNRIWLCQTKGQICTQEGNTLQFFILKSLMH